jgi:hypothetical protein
LSHFAKTEAFDTSRDSLAQIVGTHSCSFRLPSLPPFPLRHGVGTNPDSFSKVRQPGVGSTQHTPPSIKPQRGKVTQNSVESSKSKHWRVLNECVEGSYFAKYSGKLAPQSAALSIKSRSVAGCANVLAGEPSAHNVNESAPGLAVECPHIVPDGEPWQDSVALSLQQDLAAVRFNLDSTNCGMSEKDAAEDASPSSCK